MRNHDLMNVAVIIAGSLVTGVILNVLDIPTIILESIYNSIDIISVQVPEGPFANTSTIGIETMKACISFLISFGGWVSFYLFLKPIIKKISSF